VTIEHSDRDSIKEISLINVDCDADNVLMSHIVSFLANRTLLIRVDRLSESEDKLCKFLEISLSFIFDFNSDIFIVNSDTT